MSGNHEIKLSRFLRKNLIRTLIYLSIIIGCFLLFKHFVGDEIHEILEPVTSRPYLVYFIYSTSELVFGIVPPEFFLSWALSNEVGNYVVHVLAFSTISYLAGLLNFTLGLYLSHTRLFKRFFKRYIDRYKARFEKLEHWVIAIAALTPLPFSFIALTAGAMDYSFKKYLLFSLFRFLRFAVYGFIIWESRTLIIN